MTEMGIQQHNEVQSRKDVPVVGDVTRDAATCDMESLDTKEGQAKSDQAMTSWTDKTQKKRQKSLK